MHTPESSGEGSGTSFRKRHSSAAAFPLLIVLGSLLGCQTPGMFEPTRPVAESSTSQILAVEWQSGATVDGRPVLIRADQNVLATSVQTLTLANALSIASEKQPRVLTQRATLATAEAGKRAMAKLRFPVTLSSQIPIRREQANLAVIAAAAGLDQAERETAYNVTRTYFMVLFARQQERVAQSTAERLNSVKEAAEQALQAGARDVSAADVERTLVYQRLAETRRIQATQGVKRALVALREAIGLEPEVMIDVAMGDLPEIATIPKRETVMAEALSRRPELIQTKILAQITCLEADAQATSLSQRMETIAAGIDLHSAQVPQGSNGNDYRPAGVPPELPTMIMGTRPERLKQARSLVVRSEMVVATTRNLILLEIEDAFLRWEETSQQAKKAKEGAEAGDKLADGLRKDLAAGLKVKIEDVISARVLAATARAEYNEFLFKQLVALADLERASGGGFRAGFPAR